MNLPKGDVGKADIACGVGRPVIAGVIGYPTVEEDRYLDEFVLRERERAQKTHMFE